MNLRRFCNFIFIFALLVVCTTPIAHALDFKPMAGIPGLTNNGGTYTLAGFINKLYIFLITAGAVIGVVKIAFAGVKYATSDIGGSKSAAKEDIKGVLLGLAILTLPYLVLSAINPGFTKLEVLHILTENPLKLEGGNAFSGSFTSPSGSASEQEEGYTKQCPSCTTPEQSCDNYVNNCVPPKGESSVVGMGNNKYGKPQTLITCRVKPSSDCPSVIDVPDQMTACGVCSEKRGEEGSCSEFEHKCNLGGGTPIPKHLDDGGYSITCSAPQGKCPENLPTS